jgi:hypothetical protein
MGQRNKANEPTIKLQYRKHDTEKQTKLIQTFNDTINTTQKRTTTQNIDDKQIWTDGSGTSGKATKNTKAGWGFYTSTNKTHYGQVITAQSSPLYLGAKVGSNNTG